MSPRALLLQARHQDDPARPREARSFADYSGLPEHRLECHDLLTGPPSLARVRSFDLLLIGGSGEFYVSKGHLPHQERLFDLLRDITAVGHPTFASCFGYQCLVEALGGKIVHDPESLEVGTKTLELTTAGQDDPLFRQLPARFRAQMGRKDRAVELPSGYVNLASSELCPQQGFRVPGQAIWASQFHPELDGDENRRRFERYLEGYAAAMSREEREEALASFHPSPEANTLLRAFMDLVFPISQGG
ncbi:MAG: type 1 glutamine amidotransferase [Acidobacteriota bacterium]